ncbi:MAG: hypothetical protein ACD_75C01350G0006 [uncultured bacterium]|nr:MAG: hypothetical protein ACD_75C01350G0006 [uncultured bacterium]
MASMTSMASIELHLAVLPVTLYIVVGNNVNNWEVIFHADEIFDFA